MRIDGKLYWLHTIGITLLNYYAYHAKRGKAAMDAINILPRFQGRVVHDDLPSYFQYDFRHALCNAHHLSILLFLQERFSQKWIKSLVVLLLKIKQKVNLAQKKNKTRLSHRQEAVFSTQFDRLIQEPIPPHRQQIAELGNADG